MVSPDDGALKFNADGSAKGKPGIGGLLRNSEGVVVALFSILVGVMDSNVAEVLAIKEACKMLNKKVEFNSVKIVIKSDSLNAVSWARTPITRPLRFLPYFQEFRVVAMERGFLSQKGSGVGRGVKEKNVNGSKTNTSSGIGVSTESDNSMNEDTPVGVTFAVQECVTPSVEKEKQSSFLSPRIVITYAGNAPGKSSYANAAGKPNGKKLNIRTLFTSGGNGIDVVVPVESIRAVSDRFSNTVYGFFLGKRAAYPVVANYVKNT
ncbi:retrovirus-related pol polyprotein from transposon TNT 1-94 [Tanacetum coccineum]